MTKFLLGFFSFGWLRGLDFLPPLLFRLFLAPLFWYSGQQKLGLFTATDTVWYNPLTWVNSATYQAAIDQMSNVPLMSFLPSQALGFIGWLEVIGAFLIFIGLAVRWISIPLLGLIAITALIALNGQDVVEALKGVVMGHGYTDMTDSIFGKSTIYLLMLLALFFMGAGRFFSVDWFLYRRLNKKILAQRSTKAAAQQPSREEDPFELDNTTD